MMAEPKTAGEVIVKFLVFVVVSIVLAAAVAIWRTS